MDPTPLERAIKILGDQSKLARKIGVKPQHVWHWQNKAKRIPAEYVLSIEKATDGQVTRSELRPDIYPRESKGEAA